MTNSTGEIRDADFLFVIGSNTSEAHPIIAMEMKRAVRRGATMDDSHLFYFTADSLSQMMESCGFKVLRVEEGLRPYRFGAARSAPIL